MDEEPGDVDGMPPGFEARPYQRRIVQRTVDLFRGTARDRKGEPESLANSVLVESPTGSGKTVMGLAVARWLQRHEGMTVGWAAMRRNLLSQAAAENARGFGVDLKLISMFDKRPPQVDLLVIDEAQHDGALSMANLHSVIKPKKILGLSATPFRSDRFKLCFERSLRDAGIQALIQDGYLSPYRHFTIPRYTPADVAEAYAREPDRWGQTLIFFHTLKGCRECRSHLADRGVAAEVVTAQTNRDRQIADFAAGRSKVLINMIILSEGFDCPSLRTVFCRPSGKLCTVQMAGRALRRHPGEPVKQVVQCGTTRHPFPRTAAPTEQYLWDEGAADWRSLAMNASIDGMVQRMQLLLAGSKSDLPALLQKQNVRRGHVWQTARDHDLFHNVN